MHQTVLSAIHHIACAGSVSVQLCHFALELSTEYAVVLNVDKMLEVCWLVLLITTTHGAIQSTATIGVRR